MVKVRVDRWLCAVRIFKSRTLAQQACARGNVQVDGLIVRSSHPVTIGVEVTAHCPRCFVILDVVGLAEKRLSAKLASELYVDRSPPPPPKEDRFPARERGTGRPTKAERRALLRFRRE